MTVKGGSRPACASCRFQRRRCSLDCPLAPYFPATKPEIFQNVHSLYGVGHILKILNKLKDDGEKEDAMQSIIFESNIRQNHPVYGCYGVTFFLQRKINEATNELRLVLRALDECKKRQEVMQNSLDNGSDQVVGGSSDLGMNGGSDLGFQNNVESDYGVSNDRNDDKTGKAIDLTSNQSQVDEFEQFLRVLEDEESMNFTDIMCDSFLDDQLFFMGSKETHDLKLESSLEKDTTYFEEPQELKVNEKLSYGVPCSTTGF